ncbi:bolA-like protein 3 [Pectinophora gossypiella]|uniref:bolA-like protein 3 n=1 Tax=Pectinophora gossypiella TaxID=13191 RepID=UPI00214E7EEA|nr:bolA-like protein 3 [Pectinophora gossypiella]
MFRQFIKALGPVRNRWARAVASAGGEASGTNAFKNNCKSKEQQLTDTLRRALPGITYISVTDVSGGCGAMFEINVEASEFTGLSRVKQHRLVTDTLKTEISEMHGIRIHTTPSQTDK